MNISVINTLAKEVEKLKLDPKIFDGRVNLDLIHQATTTFLANQRKGLAKAKTRGEVSGGGIKPWRQKGTGRARVGSIRSPLWRKGGIIFGPRPRSYYKELPKKMKLEALRSVLNAKLKDKEIVILDRLDIKSHKTKDFAQIIKNLKFDGQKLRFVTKELSGDLKLASRNIREVQIEMAKGLNAYDALDCKKLIFTKEAFSEVIQRIENE